MELAGGAEILTKISRIIVFQSQFLIAYFRYPAWAASDFESSLGLREFLYQAIASVWEAAQSENAEFWIKEWYVVHFRILKYFYYT